MEIEKIFNDLESNQTFESEEAKKKLIEFFTQCTHKDQWLVNCMLEYFHKTGSMRIVEVLVKVQAPHDVYIFERLADWLKDRTLRVDALNLFCFIVRKRPTWLYKVEKHRLIKEILKVLMNEKEIVPLMSALISIITLLPIIPNLVPNFLNELFHVFGQLVSWNWNCQNPKRLPDDKLVHLQLGLQMLFHRLYGMYPCNFLAFLSNFVKEEKGAIFIHTIKPLLETVRVHPLLVTATSETEVLNLRWKEMEPHDVVVECAKMSLPGIHQDFSSENTYNLTTNELLETPSVSSMRCTPVSSTIRSGSMSSSGFAYNYKDFSNLRTPVPLFDSGLNNDLNNAIWSPYNEIITTNPIPVTPTPSYVLPLATQHPINSQMLNVTGSSPPEAAVEATPETTPMKDIKDIKHSSMINPSAMANPLAVRAIFPKSQPSSPLRKEQNQFHFPDVESEIGATTTTNVLEQRLVSRITTSCDRRVQQVIQDRSNSQSPFQTIEAQASKLGYRSPFDTSLKSATPDIDTDISSNSMNCTPTPLPTPIPTPTQVEHITKICDDCNETDRSMCTAGGLHIPTSRSMQLLVKGIKRRNRMASYCYNDSSCEKMNSSKKDASLVADSVKVRRTKSCSSICSSNTPKLDEVSDDDNDESSNATAASHEQRRRLQKSGKMLSIATAATKNVLITSNENAASQTVLIMPEYYENLLYELLLETRKMRNDYECNLLQPHEILDQYVLRTIRSKELPDQEQHALLCLQLQYERYRREIHAERNRRLLGRSRDKRSLEMERDRLREQLKNFAAKNKDLVSQIDRTMKQTNEREQIYTVELLELKSKYQNELERNKCLRLANENLMIRLNEELTNRKTNNYELEALRGQIFSLTTELQHAQLQAEKGLQCKHELARLEAEFIVMGEVQLKCRDRLTELDNFKARDEEMQVLNESYNIELKEIKQTLEDKSALLDSAKHKIAELQAKLINHEKDFTEQKRLLKAVKDEYEENFKLLNKKYEVQKIIISQMEGKIILLHRPHTSNTYSPDTDKTDIASSMERNSPLSTSVASSESLSASLRSSELKNLQQLVEVQTVHEPSSSINVVGASVSINNEGGAGSSRIASFDLASSAHTATVFNPSFAAASTSSAAAAAAANVADRMETTYNYDMITTTATTTITSTTTSHSHPHLHFQQQQQHQQQEKQTQQQPQQKQQKKR